MGFPFKGCSAVLLFSGDMPHGANPNFLQHAGADVDGAILVWSRNGKTLITSKMNAAAAERLFAGRVLAVDAAQIGPAIKKLLPAGKWGWICTICAPSAICACSSCWERTAWRT